MRNLYKVEAPVSTMELSKQVEKEDATSQTEPFSVDVEMKDASKENLCQTVSPGRDIPIALKKLHSHLSLKTYALKSEIGTQVSPFMIEPFEVTAKPIGKKVVNQVVTQALQEIHDQMGLRDAQSKKIAQFEVLQNLHRTIQFKVEQEKFRVSSSMLEHSVTLRDIDEEELGESGIAALCFAHNYLRNVSAGAVARLRQERFLWTKGTYEIVFKRELNENVNEYLKSRKQAPSIVDDLIVHAVRDLEMFEI